METAMMGHLEIGVLVLARDLISYVTLYVSPIILLDFSFFL